MVVDAAAYREAVTAVNRHVDHGVGMPYESLIVLAELLESAASDVQLTDDDAPDPAADTAVRL